MLLYLGFICFLKGNWKKNLKNLNLNISCIEEEKQHLMKISMTEMIVCLVSTWLSSGLVSWLGHVLRHHWGAWRRTPLEGRVKMLRWNQWPAHTHITRKAQDFQDLAHINTREISILPLTSVIIRVHNGKIHQRDSTKPDPQRWKGVNQCQKSHFPSI